MKSPQVSRMDVVLELKPLRVVAETAGILFAPMLIVWGVTRGVPDSPPSVSGAGHALLAVYLSAAVAVGTITFLSASVARLELTWTSGMSGLLLCLALLFGFTDERVQRPLRSSEPGVFASAYLVDLLLLGAAWSFARLFAMGVKRPSYLAMAAMAATIADVYSVWGGPTKQLVSQHEDFLSARVFFQWFVPGERGARPLMGVGDLVFLGLFLWGARRFAFPLRLNVAVQTAGLMVAYAVVIGLQKPLAGLLFIGPLFLIVNWKRFEITRSDWRAIACLITILVVGVGFMLSREIR